MMKVIKENVGLIIALLISIYIAIEIFNAFCQERYAEDLIRQYVELIKTATNYENN